ncbi:MAG: DUF6364 family protein [Gemmatimonadota bacterium]
MAKIPKNLSLDAEDIEIGLQYAERNGVSLSKVVSEFLRSLPNGEDGALASPALERLIGSAKKSGAADDGPSYHEYLEQKYR